MKKYLAIAIEAARRAGKIQREHLWQPHDIRFKGDINLVTDIDQACEKEIVTTIRTLFPEHDILAEENDYQTRNSTCQWVIDPLDGTTNYAHGFPWFCVSIALAIEGEVRLGVIYHVMLDELFTVVRNDGAFLNGKRLSVSNRQPLKQCLLATGFPYDRTPDNENNFANFVQFQLAARGVRRAGAAALDLAYVAAGRLDGYWECKLKPWDVAAGALLVREAGGSVSNHAGEPHSLHDHRILASNGIIHGEMLEILARGAQMTETL